MSLGLMDGSETVVYLNPVWNPIGTVVVGLLFGYGMLARLGRGDLRAFVMAIVMGLSAYFVMSGPLASSARLALSRRNRRHGPTGVYCAGRTIFGCYGAGYRSTGRKPFGVGRSS